MSYGRGGAGNIAARGTPAGSPATLSTSTLSQAPSTTAAADLEASRSPTAPQTQHILPEIDPCSPPRRPGEYAHTGRGGAGNWYQPIEAGTSGSYNTSTSAYSAEGPVSKAAGQPQKAQWAGRGGAGNFQPTSTEKKDEKAEEAAEVSKQAERDVEMGLPRPAHAFLGGRERVADIGSVVEEEGVSM